MGKPRRCAGCDTRRREAGGGAPKKGFGKASVVADTFVARPSELRKSLVRARLLFIVIGTPLRSGIRLVR